MGKRHATGPQLRKLHEACVLEVKARSAGVNPWAVCRSAMNRAHGSAAVSKALKGRRL